MMSTKLNSQDDGHLCTSSKLECNLKPGDGDQDRNGACVHIAAGMNVMSMAEQDQHDQASPSRNSPHNDQQQLDTERIEEAAYPDQRAFITEPLSDLLSEVSGVHSQEPESSGFPETEHCGYSLESYLSDFKSSSSSDWKDPILSESCIDGLLGKLDSLVLSAPVLHSHEQKEDAIDDNRCPSTFYASEREDSLFGQQRAGAKQTSAFFVTSKEDAQGVARVTMENQGEDLYAQNLGLKDRSSPPLEADKPSEKQEKDNRVTQVSVVKEKNVSDDSSSLGFVIQTEGPEKEDVCSLRPKGVCYQTSFGPSSQIISEDHLQALRLLGLTDCILDQMEDAGIQSLGTSSLSQGDLPSGQSLTHTTEASLSFKDTDIVPFASDCLADGSLLSTKMGSRPQVHDPDYVKDGCIFCIEDSLPPVQSDDDSMLDILSSCTPPPVPHFQMSSTDQQSTNSGVLSHEGLCAVTSRGTVSMNNDCHRDLSAQSDLWGSCSVTDASFLGLPSKITAGVKEVSNESSVILGFSPRMYSSPQENLRLEPAPLKGIHDSTPDIPQMSAGNPQQRDTAERRNANTAGLRSQQDCMMLPQTDPQVLGPSKKSRPSDDCHQLVPFSSSLDYLPSFSEDHSRSSHMPPSGMLAGNSNPQYGEHVFAGRDSTRVHTVKEDEKKLAVHSHSTRVHTVTEDEKKLAVHSQGERCQSGSNLAQVGQRAVFLPASHTSHSQWFHAGKQRAESCVPQSSAEPARVSLQSFQLSPSVQQPLGTTIPHCRMHTDAESRTVVVTGQLVDQDQKDWCELYFDNEKRSSGGDIEENGIIWSEEKKCFFITFVDSQVAGRVASRAHMLNNTPVQVQLWSSPAKPGAAAAQQDRILVSGVPGIITSDCLQNYLECHLDVEVKSVQFNSEKNSALVVFDLPHKNIDVKWMEQTCQKDPLEKGVNLTFHEVPVSASRTPAVCRTIQVTGLKPETATESIKYFFSNKRRNLGGPVISVDRDPGTTSALVHFENPADAESVVKKGNHVLDDQSLHVCLHHDTPPLGGMPGQQGTAVLFHGAGNPPQGTPSINTSDVRTSAEETRLWSQNQQSGATPGMSRPQELSSSNVGRDFTGNVSSTQMYSQWDADDVPGMRNAHTPSTGQGFTGNQFFCTASAQMQIRRETEPRGAAGYGPGYQTGQEEREPRGTAGYGSGYQTGQEERESRGTAGYWSDYQTGQGERKQRGAAGYGPGCVTGQGEGEPKGLCGYGSDYPSGTQDYHQSSRRNPSYASMASTASTYRELPVELQHQSGPSVHSELIDSHSYQTKDKSYQEGKGSFALIGNGPQPSAPCSGVEHNSHHPPGPGFRPEVVNAKSFPRTVRLKIGSDVRKKIVSDSNLLGKMIQEVRSMQGRIQWENFDHIVISCRADDADQNWEHHVTEMMNLFVQPIKQQLQREEFARQEAPMTLNYPESTISTITMDTSVAAVNTQVGSPRDTQKPLCLAVVEDSIPNLKPAQMKILKLSKTMEKLKKDFPGLEICVDEERKTAQVRAPESSMKKAFTGVLAFVTNLAEMNISLSPAMAQMLKKKDAQDWIQKTSAEQCNLFDWEVCDDHIVLSAQRCDFLRIEQMLRSAFSEGPSPLTEKDASLLKSPAWTSFLERIQEMDRGGCPTPVLFPEETQIIIVDTPSNIGKTRLSVKKFFDENKIEKEELPMNANHVRFLKKFCQEETKAVHSKAKNMGVTVTFTETRMAAEGPKDSLAQSIGEVRELIGRIKEDKMTFKTPGAAKYLKGAKGQEFLTQTGMVTDCFITTSSGGGVNSEETAGRLLARVTLDTNHHVLIMQGDITQCTVDAIVNAANEDLSHGGGVALAIAKAGGRSIQEESEQIIASHGRLREGEVAVTGPGSLNCQHVLHAVGPTWQGGHQGEHDLLKRTVMATLRKAESMELSSVAMPAISCGIFRYPVDQATRIIIQAINSYFKEVGAKSCIKQLTLIDSEPNPLHGLLQAAKDVFKKCVEIKGEPKASAHSGAGKHHHRGGVVSGTPERGHDRDSHSGHGGRAPIKIIPGEIARSKADVIVCATHPSGDLKKGILSKSILDRGGEAIQQDLHSYVKQHGQMELGKVVWTSPGTLECKAVYHLSLPSWRDDQGQKMHTSVKECLDIAIRKNARSIAFPTLGTGRLGYPSDQTASIMFSAIRKWFQRNPHSSMKEVQIIVYSRDTETLQAFKAAESGGEGSHGCNSYRGDHHSGDRHSGDRHHSHGGGNRNGGGGAHRGDRHGGDGRHRGGHSGSRGHGHSDRGEYSSGEMRGLKTKMGKVTVMVKEGNILTEPCDAIVNSNNDNLDLAYGLSKEISKACGQDLMDECRSQRETMSRMGVAITKVNSSQLSCSSVIHVSMDRYKHSWQEGILAVLQAADKKGFESISLPALGTGGKGADPVALAETMQKAVSKFSDQARKVREVRVVVFQKSLLTSYIEAFDPGTATGGATDRDYSPGTDKGESSDRDEENREAELSVDVYIYSTKASGIAEARKKIYEHVQSICTSQVENNPLIASFSKKEVAKVYCLQSKHGVEISVDQKKSSITIRGEQISVMQANLDLKEIIVSATRKHHLAAGMPPVLWQYESGKDRFSNFDPEQIILIEGAFKRKDASVQFADKRGRKYKIVFKDRKEYPVDHPGHPVAIKRRDLLEEKKQEIPLPTHWSPMKGEKVKRVELKPDSSEYKKVAGHFGQQAQIKKIERIQNPTLFQQFKVKKKDLEQNNPKGTENEKRLFHGTHSDSVNSIINNGFNRSYCGRNGTALGCGVYFAADASVSMGYAKGGHMFQARVLVGEYTPGNSSMKYAPNKPNSIRPFDSVSNAPTNASVFVIFHDSQAYPEYLISF